MASFIFYEYDRYQEVFFYKRFSLTLREEIIFFLMCGIRAYNPQICIEMGSPQWSRARGSVLQTTALWWKRTVTWIWTMHYSTWSCTSGGRGCGRPVPTMLSVFRRSSRASLTTPRRSLPIYFRAGASRRKKYRSRHAAYGYRTCDQTAPLRRGAQPFGDGECRVAFSRRKTACGMNSVPQLPTVAELFAIFVCPLVATVWNDAYALS